MSTYLLWSGYIFSIGSWDSSSGYILSVGSQVLPQWHIKDPGHSAKSAGDRLHLNMHTPWPNKVRVGWLCHCPGIVREPIRKRAHMSGGTQPHLSQYTEPLLTDPGIKGGISVHKLITTKKRKKEMNEWNSGNEWLNILPKSSQARKKPPPPPPHILFNSVALQSSHKDQWHYDWLINQRKQQQKNGTRACLIFSWQPKKVCWFTVNNKQTKYWQQHFDLQYY